MDFSDHVPLLSGVAGWILGVLNKAVGPFLVEKLGAGCKELKRWSAVKSLPEPGKLAELIAKGDVKPGEFVEGEAFFSLHTEGPATLQPAMGIRFGSGEEAMTILEMGPFPMNPGMHIPTDSSLPQTPIARFHSSTRYPIFNDVTRVGFLYPKSMNGFVVPISFTGTPLFTRQETCAVYQAELQDIEDAAVKYRGVVREIPRSAAEGEFGPFTDEGYEQARKLGLLRFLSFVEDGTYIKRAGSSEGRVLYGGHFLRTHWSAAEPESCEGFAEALGEAIDVACKDAGLPPPRRIHHTQNGPVFHRWTGRGVLVTSPERLPLLDLQVITDIVSAASMEDERRFKAIKDIVINRLDQKFAREQDSKNDVDGHHDFRPAEHTVLQSSAAKGIKHPIAAGVRGWLEKRARG